MFRRSLAFLLTMSLASCAATIDPTPTPTATPASCNDTFAAAAAADGLRNQVEALDQTVRTCGSIEEWEAAFNRQRGAFMLTADARTVLENMCLYSSAVIEEPLCHEALVVP